MKHKNYLNRVRTFTLLLSFSITIGVQAQDMLSTPLTLEAITSGTITMNNPETSALTIEYSLDGTTWTTASTSPAITIDVAAGDIVRLRGNNERYGNPDHNITSTAEVYVYGNIMSLVHAEDFATNLTLTEPFTFRTLFSAGRNISEGWTVIPNATIKSHPDKQLLLPAPFVPCSCYTDMFAGCTALERAPELPATQMDDWFYDSDTQESYDGSIDCYMSMFEGCTGLTQAPAVLPSTTLVHGVYQYMFAGCTSLERAPDLPAAKVADTAYSYMFAGCTSLNYVKCMATDISEEYAVTEWLQNVSATGTFVKAGGMDAWPIGSSGIPEGWIVKDDSDELVTTDTPLTIEAMEDGTNVSIVNPLELTIEYSTDGGTTWTQSLSSSISISDIPAGGTVQLRGDNATYSSDGTATNSMGISADKDYYLYGNIMSLISSHDFGTLTTLTSDYAFARLFRNDSHLNTHSSKPLLLPATTLSPNCYRYTFQSCTALTQAPELPAAVMTEGCYFATFIGCSSLQVPPQLPSTQLAPGCYTGLFANSGLKTAPELPATQLAERCYYQMFYGCRDLESAPQLPALEVPRSGYNQMFMYCSSLVDTPELPAHTVGGFGYNMMFRGCTGLTASPALPATTLVDEDSYQAMFYDCTNIETAGDLSATTLGSSYSCSWMFYNCSKLTKAPVLPATTLTPYCYNRMFDGCTSLVTAPELPATELAELCYNDMFWECTALKNAPALPAKTLVPFCYTMMFYGCTSLEKAPDLPAQKLEGNCYEHMFMGCSSLSYVKCLATDISEAYCIEGWMDGVSPTGTFVKAEGMDDWILNSVDGIPTGWTVETATGIQSVAPTEAPDEKWFTIDGRPVGDGKPVTKGVYVKDGQKAYVR